MAGNLPAWYTPEQQAAPSNAPLPSWYSPEPEPAPAAKTPSVMSQANDLGANVITGLLRIPGAIGGIPHMLGHTANYGKAQVFNALDAVTGGKGGHTGAEMDAQDPVMSVLPSSQDIDNVVEHPPLPDFMTRAVNGSGPGKFYTPESVGGRVFQAGVTAAGSGGANLPSAIKTGLAGMAAEGSNELFPDNPALAALTAFLTHIGAGQLGRGAKVGYEGVAPILSPKSAGKAGGARAVADADNTQPGLALPSRQELDHAADATRTAVDDIGPGANDYDAGGTIRSNLQARKDALVKTRGDAADEAFGVFRQQSHMPGTELAPLMSSPTFRSAVRRASNSVLDKGEAPLTDYFQFRPEDAGEPTIIPHAAVPPDVLQRIREKLGDELSDAKGSDKDSVGTLVGRFDAVMNKRYPQTFAPTRTEFAQNSKPINEMEDGPVGRVLDSDTRYGRRTYAMPQDKVAGTFLKSGALRSDFDSLIKAHGGDKTAALKSLEGNLADKVQGAIQGDGTLSLDAFNRAVRPYTKALNMWFPDLAQKFSSAEGAQRTLDTLRTQDALGQTIREGGMRNADGLVTAESAQAWFTKNAKLLEGSGTPGTAQARVPQSRAAVARVKQIIDALPHSPAGGAEAALEGVPAAVGFSLGGAESGIFGAMFHAIPKAIAGPRLAKFAEAYSGAVERAIADPVYAAHITKGINMRPRGMTPTQALGRAILEDFKSGVLSTPSATLAGANVPKPR